MTPPLIAVCSIAWILSVDIAGGVASETELERDRWREPDGHPARTPSHSGSSIRVQNDSLRRNLARPRS